MDKPNPKNSNTPLKPILLPKDQLEVLSLKHNWQKLHNHPLPVKTCIPSWSLIATICAETTEVGFLPDFLARKFNLFPVSWQPKPSPYRILAIHQHSQQKLEDKVKHIIQTLESTFKPNTSFTIK